MIVHGLFAEVPQPRTGLILGNVNYVKKVVFPLEILPGNLLEGRPVSHLHQHPGLIGRLRAVQWLSPLDGPVDARGLPPCWSSPPLALPGCSPPWGSSSATSGQTIGIVTTVLMFLSPVFYPHHCPAAKPTAPGSWPTRLPSSSSRRVSVLIWGHLPDWSRAGHLYHALALLIAWFGFAWFHKTRKGFCGCPLTTLRSVSPAWASATRSTRSRSIGCGRDCCAAAGSSIVSSGRSGTCPSQCAKRETPCGIIGRNGLRASRLCCN